MGSAVEEGIAGGRGEDNAPEYVIEMSVDLNVV
jgi:hypothetical protein